MFLCRFNHVTFIDESFKELVQHFAVNRNMLFISHVYTDVSENVWSWKICLTFLEKSWNFIVENVNEPCVNVITRQGYHSPLSKIVL